jgi:hydroxyacylglutathione hydrolase
MSQLAIHQFPCLKDNYGVLIHNERTGETASIDAPDAEAVMRALGEKGWQLTHILATHHHADHTAGNLELKRKTNCTVIGPKAEAARIPALDRPVQEGDTVLFGGETVRVLDTPGHTIGHVSYWIPERRVAFVGDTLFAMGCGRVLEGNHEMMWASLKKLKDLPRDTEFYCGHEYTLANAKFGLTIEPENAALAKRAREVEELRAQGKPTLPTRLSLELDTNVFLRPHSSAIRIHLGMPAAADWRVFGEMRERKNRA